MQKKYILLFIVLYITILNPLISSLGNILVARLVSSISELHIYQQLLEIPMWFIPLAISFTIEKGYVKTGAFVMSGVYIFFKIGILIWAFFDFPFF